MITSLHSILDIDDSEYLVMGQSYCRDSKNKVLAVYIGHLKKKDKGRGGKELDPLRMKKVLGLGFGCCGASSSHFLKTCCLS